MVSRRTLLRTVGAATGGAFAGCTSLYRGDEGYVQLKSVQARYRKDDRLFDDAVLRVELSAPPGAGPPDLTYLREEWENGFDAPREPVVDDALHDDLARAYEEVRYVVGVCSPDWADDGESVGCYNVSTSRENFNRVQVHDRVRASSDGASLSIYSVEGEWAFESD